MNNIQYFCTLSTPAMEPLYKRYYGLMMTFVQLSMDIMANVKLLRCNGIHILDYKVPTIEELYDCWSNNKDLVYIVDCEESEYNMAFTITANHTEQ